ncbi:MAG TPA: DUF302 domain-containing protein [Polyangiaceae bacterium]|jgi:uncharacterized protein (DUF302 family)|nr:DUF302 domain-containing protein [Polyangiaceae bacterium]
MTTQARHEATPAAAAPAPTHGSQRRLALAFDAAVEALPAALKAEGFGVITEIDLAATFKAKLGVDFRKYRIFGACNPTLAHRALGHDLSVGVLLPCNVVLYEGDDGVVTVGAVDPTQTLGGGADDPELAALARDVGERLSRALAALAAA